MFKLFGRKNFYAEFASFWDNEQVSVLIAEVCIALFRQLLRMRNTKTRRTKRRMQRFSFAPLLLINDFKTHLHGIVLLDGAEVVE